MRIGLGGGDRRWRNRVRFGQGWVVQAAAFLTDADYVFVGHRVLHCPGGDIVRNPEAVLSSFKRCLPTTSAVFQNPYSVDAWIFLSIRIDFNYLAVSTPCESAQCATRTRACAGLGIVAASLVVGRTHPMPIFRQRSRTPAKLHGARACLGVRCAWRQFWEAFNRSSTMCWQGEVKDSSSAFTWNRY